MTVDPVCGMHLGPASAAERRDSASGSHFFCSAHRAATFDAHPGRYRAPAAGGTSEGGQNR